MRIGGLCGAIPPASSRNSWRTSRQVNGYDPRRIWRGFRNYKLARRFDARTPRPRDSNAESKASRQKLLLRHDANAGLVWKHGHSGLETSGAEGDVRKF